MLKSETNVYIYLIRMYTRERERDWLYSKEEKKEEKEQNHKKVMEERGARDL